MVIEELEQAWQRRQALLAELREQSTQAYRLLDAEWDRVPGLVVEVFGPTAVFQWFEGRCDYAAEELISAAQWCVVNAGISQVYFKKFVADRSGEMPEEALKDPKPFFGAASAPEFEIQENGRKFLIHPYDGFSVGLFLDQRNNREALAQLGAKRVLNLFSYTCAFSIYCATTGAETTSVDVSKKYLEWGRKNLAANGIAPEGHRFFQTDARVFLEKAAKKGEKYDLVIVDPPSFGRAKKGKPFSLRKDLEGLLGLVRAVTAPGAAVYVSANLSQWSQKEFEALVARGLGQGKALPLPKLPSDFGGDPITYQLVRLR
ncbi:class I SAM-dependent methyltransferase [bacterium]|nr:class I SAM-dependent methyltransferase [bacterium]